MENPKGVEKQQPHISNDPEKLDVSFIHHFLTGSYWAKGRSLEKVKACIKNSLNFGLYLDDRQIGYARVLEIGQSATLYRIDQMEFERLSNDPSSFTRSMTKGYATFEQNFEGLYIPLGKLCLNSQQTLVQEIFYPNDSLGKKRNFELDNFDVLGDLSFLETESINYLSKEKIEAIKIFLNRINKQQLLSLYDPNELNENGVYPCVWHSNEAADQAFNKRHIGEGFDKLVKLFNEAVENESIILAFVE